MHQLFFAALTPCNNSSPPTNHADEWLDIYDKMTSNYQLTLKLTSTQVDETPVTKDSPSQDYPRPVD